MAIKPVGNRPGIYYDSVRDRHFALARPAIFKLLCSGLATAEARMAKAGEFLAKHPQTMGLETNDRVMEQALELLEDGNVLATFIVGLPQ